MEKKNKYAIDIKKLNKTFSTKKNEKILALIDVNLKIPKGSLFGLLGLNGAGKSTIINVLAGLCLKDTGSVEIGGYNIDKNRKQASCQIGIVPQELNFDPFFTPKEILELQAGLYGIKKKYRKTMEILKDLDLHNKANSYTRSLSGGMKRRLMIAKALVHNPSILVLDEPTAGVDVTLRQQLWKYIKNLQSKKKTILLTTHYIEEAEKLCDRICIVANGRILLSETKKKIMKSTKNQKLEDTFIKLTKS
ncbi:MAG: Daunorubicin/doxorubicin resistance ATP-binding protein DrrA [Alphaproteobacteria bacterium MarineAlpha6_Bin4]|nr:MAG: Daunorubicin/doxorubicin resistance ATP-binding protein DrrA [Alphaproteobacteria bacterium MarineAlpha6_Bin5]PPR37720.1 MAG: Daunorubicin/doxorubicin resistance ATP-binding protein DrrA [Alphaproteobacteria bacterium MarineAlpha6_Bin4]